MELGEDIDLDSQKSGKRRRPFSIGGKSFVSLMGSRSSGAVGKEIESVAALQKRMANLEGRFSGNMNIQKGFSC